MNSNYSYTWLFVVSIILVSALLLAGVNGQVDTATNEIHKTSSNPPAAIDTTPIFSIQRLGIDDPTINSTITVLYGSFTGDSSCQMKAACISGQYFKDFPLKSLILSLLRTQIPTAWSTLFDVFNAAADYGRNCDAYVCSSARSPPR